MPIILYRVLDRHVWSNPQSKNDFSREGEDDQRAQSLAMITSESE